MKYYLKKQISYLIRRKKHFLACALIENELNKSNKTKKKKGGKK